VPVVKYKAASSPLSTLTSDGVAGISVDSIVVLLVLHRLFQRFAFGVAFRPAHNLVAMDLNTGLD
jgi:hypothetical protein